jgi:hypothetical protein
MSATPIIDAGSFESHQNSTTLACLTPDKINGQLYLASPKQTYATKRYDRKLASVTRLFPHASVVPARGLFASDRRWRVEWPRYAQAVSALVAFADEEGWIGWGTYQEIGALLVRGAPVWFLADGGKLHPWTAIDIVEVHPPDWVQYARLSVQGSRKAAGDG